MGVGAEAGRGMAGRTSNLGLMNPSRTLENKGLTEELAPMLALQEDASCPSAPRPPTGAAVPYDTELDQVVDAWPVLSQAVKAGILAMVRVSREATRAH